MSDQIYAALDRIRENPQNWDQTSFVRRAANDCGTVMCLAGHILDESDQYAVVLTDGYGQAPYWLRADGSSIEGGLSACAAEIAGITENAGHALFLGYPLMASVHPDYLAKWTEMVLADQSLEVTQYEIMAAQFDVEYADDETVICQEAQERLEGLRSDLGA